MADLIDISFPGSVGAKVLNATAKRAAELMREETAPQLASLSPERTRKLKRGWRIRARKNVITISNRQFYVIFQKEAVRERWRKVIVEHAEELVGRAYQEVGLEMVGEEVAGMLKDAARRTPGLEYRR